MQFTATLIRITNFKDLIFQITEEQYNMLCKTKVDEKYRWEYEVTFPSKGDEEARTELRWYCQINPSRFDKAIVEKKFNPFLKKAVNVNMDIAIWTPFPTAENPTPRTYTSFSLKGISALRMTQKAAAVDPLEAEAQKE